MSGNQPPIIDNGGQKLPDNEKDNVSQLTLEEQLNLYLDPSNTNLGHVVLTNQEITLGWKKPGDPKDLARHAKQLLIGPVGDVNREKLKALETDWSEAPSAQGVLDAVRLRELEANTAKDEDDPRSLKMRKARALGFLEEVNRMINSETESYGWEELEFRRPGGPLAAIEGRGSLPEINNTTQKNQPNSAQQLEMKIYFMLRDLQTMSSPTSDLNQLADNLKAIFAYSVFESRQIVERYNNSIKDDKDFSPLNPIDAEVGVHKLIISASKLIDPKKETLTKVLETAIGFQAMREELNKR